MQPHGLYSPWNSPDQNTGMGSLSLLQGIFPTEGLNPGLLHCRWILYQLSYQGNSTVFKDLPLKKKRKNKQKNTQENKPNNTKKHHVKNHLGGMVCTCVFLLCHSYIPSSLWFKNSSCYMSHYY